MCNLPGVTYVFCWTSQSINYFLDAVMSTQSIRLRMIIVTDYFAELFAVSGVGTMRFDAGIQAPL